MATADRQQLQINIRWMVSRDLPSVLAIEEESFEFPWTEEDFINILREKYCIGMVAEVDQEVVGFMVYELLKHQLHLLNFAVAPQYRRRGVGKAMVQKLVSKLSPNQRKRIVLEVRETNLPAQLFFRAMKFRAIAVLRDYYEDTTEDAYLMQYRYRTTSQWIEDDFSSTRRLAG